MRNFHPLELVGHGSETQLSIFNGIERLFVVIISNFYRIYIKTTLSIDLHSKVILKISNQKKDIGFQICINGI